MLFLAVVMVMMIMAVIIMLMIMTFFMIMIMASMLMIVVMLVIPFPMVMRTIFMITFILLLFRSLIDRSFPFNFASLNNDLNLVLMNLFAFSFFFMAMLFILIIDQTLDIFADQLGTELTGGLIFLQWELFAAAFGHETVRMPSRMQYKVHYYVYWQSDCGYD